MIKFLYKPFLLYIMNLFESIILGIVQGITEWLPVSSSGHLVIFNELFNLEGNLSFYVMLHFATLLVLLIYFRKEILNLANLKNKKLYFILLASIPIGFVGYFFHDFVESFFSSLLLVGLFLIINSMVLYLTKNRKDGNKLNYKNTFIVGIAQMFSLLPGISRSGTTISASLLQNINKRDAINFSFLLGIPAFFGATLIEISNFSFNYTNLAGFAASFIVGYLSLMLLIKLIKENKFYIFSYYSLIVGVLLIIWEILI